LTITLTSAWWWIPSIITIVAMSYPFFTKTGDGIGGGIQLILLLIPALFVTAVAWAIAGVLK